jgi:hypothetical protein
MHNLSHRKSSQNLCLFVRVSTTAKLEGHSFPPEELASVSANLPISSSPAPDAVIKGEAVPAGFVGHRGRDGDAPSAAVKFARAVRDRVSVKEVTSILWPLKGRRPARLRLRAFLKLQSPTRNV